MQATSPPGWYRDPRDPRSENYWNGYQWAGRRMVAPVKTPMSTGKVLAIAAAVVLALCVGFVGYAVATAPKTEFERCVRDHERGLGNPTHEDSVQWCETSQRLEDLTRRAPR